jgi:integrase
MKGIYVVKRKAASTVYISYVPPGQSQIRERVETVPQGPGFASRLREAKARARDVLVKRRAAIVEGTFDLPKSRRAITFRRFVEDHYGPELRERGLRTAETEIHRLTDGPLGRHFGPMMLADFDEWKVRGFVNARRSGKLGNAVGPAAINRDLARLSNLWNRAARKGFVSGMNPVREVGRLAEPDGRVRFLTPEEEDRLLGELKGYLRDVVETALHTGIRRGALLGLRWRDVHLEPGTIQVASRLSKSRKPYTVAMNPVVREILGRVRLQSAHTGQDDFVFCKRDGSRRKSIRSAFQAACKRAGVEDFRFHDTRHDAASKIVMAGGSLYDAATHLGHRTLAMTQRYAHLSPEHMRRVAELTLREQGNVVSIRRGERTG